MGRLPIVHVIAAVAALFLPTASVAAFTVADLKMPKGYSIAVYAADVPNARQLAATPSGLVFVGSRRTGKVYAVRDSDRDNVADEVLVVAQGLNMPSGVAFRDGALYVAEVDKISKYEDIERRLRAPGPPVVVSRELPDETHHGWKFIAFGPDGRLYVPVGAPCNVCEVDPPFGTILSMRPDGQQQVTFARGIRNTVGFDWDPRTGEMWFGDNGRDHLGDDRPPCELNHAPRAGLHFGFPYIHGDGLPDRRYGIGHDADEFTAPAWRLDAHVAPLGVEFYRGNMFPRSTWSELLVAEHGSWNRSSKSGYRVMRARIDGRGKVVSYEPFVSGWLQGQSHWGRPVDFETLADGSVLVSDDDGGRIYRISYAER